MSNSQKRIKGFVTAPLGFKVNAVNAGIRRNKPDMGLIFSVVPAVAAGVFTRNKVKAAPVLISAGRLRKQKAQAILVNSGNANCCTGERGMRDAEALVKKTADLLKIDITGVLMASTGVIGKYLPREKMSAALPDLVKGLDFDRQEAVAKCILTTDKFTKTAEAAFNLGKSRITVGAIAKGAGMIRPDMATMLCFITTDLNISPRALKKALGEAVDMSFNRISVDGDMSTNDTVIVMANGLAGNKLVTVDTPAYKTFLKHLISICKQLAEMMVADGEGATKVIEITVKAAVSKKEARQAAYGMAESLLVKTMIAGENPNWGRIPAAVGASGVRFEEGKLEIKLQGRMVFRGAPVKVDREALINALKKKRVTIEARLNSGKAEFSVLASDLTAEYVKINTEYN